MGTCGVIVATAGVGLLFRTTEKVGVDCRNAVQALAGSNQEMTLRFDAAEANRIIGGDDTLGSQDTTRRWQ